LAAAGRRFLTHPRVRELYPEYLIAMHGIVRASVPLMETALGRADTLASSDPVAGGLVEYLRAHIPEERDHDVWILEDLEALGIERSTVLIRLPATTVASVVGAQYYWVLHYNPVALLGYIMLLEGYPPLRDEVEDLIKRTGYPARAFRTLIHHAETDPGHGAELDRILDRLPASTEQTAAVGLNAMWTAHLLAKVIDEITGSSRGEPAAARG
jgi:hypothetical protein